MQCRISCEDLIQINCTEYLVQYLSHGKQGVFMIIIYVNITFAFLLLMLMVEKSKT